MTNQRPGKFTKGLDSGMNEMNLKKSLYLAATLLENADKEDEAFYFHQLVEWIQDGNKLPLEPKEMEKALGI